MAAESGMVYLSFYILLIILGLCSFNWNVLADDTNSDNESKYRPQRGIRGTSLWEPSNNPGSTNRKFAQGSGSAKGSGSSFVASMPGLPPPLGFPPGFVIPGFGNAGGGIPGFGIPQFGIPPAFGIGGGGGGGGGGVGDCGKKDKECGGAGFGFGWGSGGGPAPLPYYCLPLNCNGGSCSYNGFYLNNWPMDDGNRKKSKRQDEEHNGGGDAPKEGTGFDNGESGRNDDKH